jgi:superkiller protein 3
LSAPGRRVRRPRCALRSALRHGILFVVWLLSLATALATGVQKPASTRSSGAQTAPAQRDVSNLLRTAQEALNRSDFEAASKALQQVVELEPNSVPAWFNLGYAYSGLHRDTDAIQAYEKALALAPDLFEAHLNLGVILLQTSQAPRAVEHLAKAVKLRPNHVRAHLYYGRALLHADQPEAAEAEFRQVLLLDPRLAIAHFDLGQVYLSGKRFDDARAAFAKAAELDSQLPQAELGLALAAEGLNEPGQAVSHFEKYLAAKPNDLETRFHMGKLLIEQGKNEAALENLLKVYGTKPDLRGLAAALGELYTSLKKYAEAERFYRQALVADPQGAALHRALGQALMNQEKLPEAETEFRAALKLDGRNREALHGLASTLYLEKRYADAVPLLEALVRSPKPPPLTFFVLATCYDHLAARPEALQNYEHFLELSHGQSPDQEWQAEQRAKLLRRELRK